jgi:hypothetical protein
LEKWGRQAEGFMQARGVVRARRVSTRYEAVFTHVTHVKGAVTELCW